MSKIFFKKEINGNVTIRKSSDSTILYSLPPNQVISADIANNNNIIIKSAVATEKERGIIINWKDISKSYCQPIIPNIATTLNQIIEALSSDFFFNVNNGSGNTNVLFFDAFEDFPTPGVIDTVYIDKTTNKAYNWNGINYKGLDREIEFYEGLENFPVVGEFNKLYCDTNYLNIYFWYYSYLKFTSGIQNLENEVLGKTKAVLTFFLDFTFTSNERYDFTFLLNDIKGHLKVRLTAVDDVVNGVLEKNIEFAQKSNILSVIAEKNEAILDSRIANLFGISSLSQKPLSGFNRTFFSVLKRTSAKIDKVKVELFFESAEIYDLPGYISAFMAIEKSEKYISALPTIPYCYETTGFLPEIPRVREDAKQIVRLDDGTKVLTNQNYSFIQLNKIISTSAVHPLNSSYVGSDSKYQNYVDVVDTGSGVTTITSKTNFTNLILTSSELTKLISGTIFSTHGDLELTFGFMHKVGGTPTHYNAFNDIKTFTINAGWNNLDFSDISYFEGGINGVVAIKYTSKIQATREIALFGGINILS